MVTLPAKEGMKFEFIEVLVFEPAGALPLGAVDCWGGPGHQEKWKILFFTFFYFFYKKVIKSYKKL